MPESKLDPFEPTDLRTYYGQLHSMHQKEETEEAEKAMASPKLISEMFENSVKKAATYPAIEMEFHPGTRKPLKDPPVPVEKIRRTSEFASQLAKGSKPKVYGPKDLKFRFVEREIFPLRTTLPNGPRPGRRWMDLLLVGADGLPVVSELKIRQDRLTFYALIQSLMYAAELSSKTQLKRLAAHYPDANFEIPKKGPVLDIFIIAFDPPERGLYRKPSYEATRDLSEKLMVDPKVNKVIRRIAYLSSPPEGKDLKFKKGFCFPK